MGPAGAVEGGGRRRGFADTGRGNMGAAASGAICPAGPDEEEEEEEEEEKEDKMHHKDPQTDEIGRRQ